MWANTVNVYNTLTPELRALADSLRVIHTNAPGDVRIDGGRSNPAWIESGKQFMSMIYRAEHPAVVVHPETGSARCCSAVSRTGWSAIPTIFRGDHPHAAGTVTRPENTVRWHWPSATSRSGTTVRRNTARSSTTATRTGGASGSRLRGTPVGVDGRPKCRVEGRRLHVLRRRADLTPDHRRFGSGGRARDLGDRGRSQHLAHNVAEAALEIVDEREPGLEPVGRHPARTARSR